MAWGCSVPSMVDAFARCGSKLKREHRGYYFYLNPFLAGELRCPQTEHVRNVIWSETDIIVVDG